MTDIIPMGLATMETILFTSEIAHPLKTPYRLRSVSSAAPNYQNPLELHTVNIREIYSNIVLSIPQPPPTPI
jgi:hypothetical protein